MTWLQEAQLQTEPSPQQAGPALVLPADLSERSPPERRARGRRGSSWGAPIRAWLLRTGGRLRPHARDPDCAAARDIARYSVALATWWFVPFVNLLAGEDAWFSNSAAENFWDSMQEAHTTRMLL